jgi:hypothetical protein
MRSICMAVIMVVPLATAFSVLGPAENASARPTCLECSGR